MKHIAAITVALITSLSALAEGGLNKITLLGEEYVHRWSQDAQHEFTPPGQEDLSVWKDMLTVNLYPNAKSGDDLANIANNLLGLYQQHGAHVLSTNSIPRTKEKEAEHFIAVALPQKEFIELVFARLAMNDEKSCSIVYSHRIYGEQAGNEASAWLQANGQKSQESLMELSLVEAFSAIGKGRQPGS